MIMTCHVALRIALLRLKRIRQNRSNDPTETLTAPADILILYQLVGWANKMRSFQLWGAVRRRDIGLEISASFVLCADKLIE